MPAAAGMVGTVGMAARLSPKLGRESRQGSRGFVAPRAAVDAPRLLAEGSEVVEGLAEGSEETGEVISTYRQGPGRHARAAHHTSPRGSRGGTVAQGRATPRGRGVRRVAVRRAIRYLAVRFGRVHAAPVSQVSGRGWRCRLPWCGWRSGGRWRCSSAHRRGRARMRCCLCWCCGHCAMIRACRYALACRRPPAPPLHHGCARVRCRVATGAVSAHGCGRTAGRLVPGGPMALCDEL